VNGITRERSGTAREAPSTQWERHDRRGSARRSHSPVTYDWSDDSRKCYELAIAMMAAQLRIVRALKWRAAN
jgi:hypothetical protein